MEHNYNDLLHNGNQKWKSLIHKNWSFLLQIPIFHTFWREIDMKKTMMTSEWMNYAHMLQLNSFMNKKLI